MERLLDQERGGRIGKARSTGDSVLRARFSFPVSLSSSLLFSLSFSLKANLCIGVAEFTSGVFFSALVLLWVSFYTTCVFLEKFSRREELVFEICVLCFSKSSTHGVANPTPVNLAKT